MSTTTTHYSLVKPAVNNPVDQDLWGGELNDDMDTIDGVLWNNSQWKAATEDIASATTCSIGGTTSANIRITGTTTITSFDTIAAGTPRWGYFSGILTLTHNATSLILPGSANITTAANDRFRAISLGSGNWLVTDYVKANGQAVITPANGFAIRSQKFTTNGTYTPNANLTYSIIECWGAGGGGGGSGANLMGHGGGAGSYSRKISSLADIGASQTVTIGTAGTGGSTGANAGSAGTDTSVGSLCVGKGGAGGGTGLGGNPGAGGIVGTGDDTSVGATGIGGGGGPGGSSIPLFGGAGGATSRGGNGRGGAITTASTTNNGASATANSGSGGGGGSAFSGGSTAAGGNGGSGYVFITEYCSA